MTEVKIFPFQPGDEDGPVFNELWEAQAFSLVIALYEQGLFTWQEWAEELSHAIEKAQQGGDPDLGDTYYQHWLSALENIVQSRDCSSGDEIDSRVEQWRSAYLKTPHGKPVLLENTSS